MVVETLIGHTNDSRTSDHRGKLQRLIHDIQQKLRESTGPAPKKKKNAFFAACALEIYRVAKGMTDK